MENTPTDNQPRAQRDPLFTLLDVLVGSLLGYWAIASLATGVYRSGRHSAPVSEIHDPVQFWATVGIGGWIAAFCLVRAVRGLVRNRTLQAQSAA
jgi:hypothetical protein